MHPPKCKVCIYSTDGHVTRTYTRRISANSLGVTWWMPSVYHQAQQPDSGPSRPVINVVQPGLHLSASALCTFYCALQSDLGQGVLTGAYCLTISFVPCSVYEMRRSSMCAGMPGFFSPGRLWGSNFRIRVTGRRPLGT